MLIDKEKKPNLTQSAAAILYLGITSETLLISTLDYTHTNPLLYDQVLINHYSGALIALAGRWNELITLAYWTPIQVKGSFL